MLRLIKSQDIAVPILHRIALGICICALFDLAGCVGSEADGLAKVKTALTSKDAKSAQIELKNFLQKHPKSGEARFLLGVQLAAADEYAAAVPEFQRALESGHPAQLVMPPMARALIKTGELSRVVSMFKDERLAQPDAMASLGASVSMALAMQGDLKGAMQTADHALALAPGSAPALLMKARLEAANNRVVEGTQILDALLAQQPGDSEAWATKGDFMLRSPGGQKAAIEAFNKALAARPGDVYSLTALVTLQLAQGDLEAAKRHFAQLKQAAPKHFVTARSDGSLAYAMGDHTRAREVFQSILRAAPTNLQVLLLAGENELRLNAPAQAEAMFAKASALAPDNPLARRLLAQAQLQMGQIPKAIVTLTPLVDASNASAEVLAMAAEARLLNGEARLADALYNRMAKLKPSDPRLRTIVATASFGRGSDEAVISELKEIAVEDSGISADMALVAAHVQRGRHDAALNALAALERKRPGEPRWHILRGQILTSKLDLAGARLSFEAALTQDTAYLPAITALAALDLRDNKRDVAGTRFKDLLKAQPNNSGAMLALAELTERQGGTAADVLKLRSNAVKAAPTDVGARVALVNHHLAIRDVDPALAAAQAAVAAMPDNIELLELLGRCQISKNESAQALASFGKIINLTPRSPHGHSLSAAVHLGNGDDESARRSIERALQLAPDHPPSLAQAVGLAMRKRQPAQALAIARKAQQTRPADAVGWALEGEIEFNQGNWPQAAAAFRKAIDKPAPGTAPRKLYATLVRADKQVDAATFASQWLKDHPKDADFIYFMGDVAQARGNLADARKHYEQTLVLAPEHVLALNNLAMLHVQTKQPGAVALAQRAAQAAPNESAVLDTLAQAQASEDRLSDAIQSQSRAVQLAPGNPELRLSLARLMLQNGDKAKAKTELDRLSGLGASFKQQDEVTRLLKSLGRG